MFLPLLGERAGVRGNGANSNSSPTTIPGTIKLRESPREPGLSQFDYENCCLLYLAKLSQEE